MLPADDVRETPPELFAARDALHHFTLDACATHENAKCSRYFTVDGCYVIKPPARSPQNLTGHNGLTGFWSGRVWVNPPFSQLWVWIAKAWATVGDREGSVELIDMLIPSTRAEQDGWQKLVEPYRDGKGTLVHGWRLDTTFLAGRQHFLKNGQPIVNEDPTSDNFGKKSSPKFGCVCLTWTRKP